MLSDLQELGLRVHELPDEPRTGDPIHLHVLASDPFHGRTPLGSCGVGPGRSVRPTGTFHAEPSAAGAQVKISTERRGSTVVVKVSNTTPAGVGERGNGLALSNVRERLLLLHDVQARFQTVHKDGVFQVRLELPA